MQKIIIATLLATCSANVALAAANPFSDVPRGHWAYDAVAQLARDGVINGYGDTTFRGDRNITRYEMAQMVAKAMAKNPKGADKALVDKLAAEFRDELDNLGVRVAKLEKHADMVKWEGYLRYTYGSERHDYNGNSAKENSDQLLLRLEPKMEVNKNWTIHTRLDASTNMKTDESGNIKLKRAYAEGNYGNFNLKFGKIGLYTNERGLIFDDEFSGGEIGVSSKDKKFRTSLMAGRINVSDSRLYVVSNRVLRAARPINNTNDYFNDKAANFLGVNLQYGGKKGFFGGLAYYRLTGNIFLMTDKGTANNDKANIWSLNLGYRFDKNFALWGAYARNTNGKDSTVFKGEDKSWQVEADYKGADYHNKGTWGAYLAYRRYGATTSIFPTTDGVGWGQKGVEIGARFVPLKNVLVTGKYFQGSDTLYSGNNDAKKLFGRIELFF